MTLLLPRVEVFGYKQMIFALKRCHFILGITKNWFAL